MGQQTLEKPTGQIQSYNQETRVTLGAQDTGRRQTKQKTLHKKTKDMSK